MAHLFLKKTLVGWAPADDEAVNLARKFTLGEVYRAEIVKPRSVKALSRYWVLVQMILDNSEVFKGKRQLHDYLKIRAGHATPIVAKSTGEIYMVADSIDFDTLGEDEFQEVWRRIVDVVAADILPGVTVPELEYEIQKLCGFAR
jgi:hypothetical protein